jgi:hypothetical protein
MGLFPVEADGKNLNRKLFCIEISPSATAGDLSDDIPGLIGLAIRNLNQMSPSVTLYQTISIVSFTC